MLANLVASPARAHAFGARYDLPLPLDLFLLGAGGAVALSFVVLALFFRVRPERSDRPRIDLLGLAPMRWLLRPAVLAVVRVVSVALFLLVLAAGFFGDQDTAANIAPTFVWVLWWVGLAYVAALVGNPWPAINPWSIVFAGVEKWLRRLGSRGRACFALDYPPWLGAWPAVVMFGLFAWLELISETAKVPQVLATAIVLYSAVTWLAMATFGREVWLDRGDGFSLAFQVFGRFAPTGAPDPPPPAGRPRHWYLRPYASDLIVDRPCSTSVTVFVLLMLSTVSFDGFKETPLWDALLQYVALLPALLPGFRELHDLGVDFRVVLETILLILAPVLFLLVYFGFSWLAKLASGTDRSVTDVAGLFVLSLVPIAVAYHLAHYLSYLLVAGQLAIPLASDPFGLGWNLLGTAAYEVDIAIIGPKFIWNTALIAIVAGHVFALCVAHFVALRVFATTRAALRSQYPLLVLMVGYTMASLWILLQPIVSGTSPGVLRAPADSVTLAPFEFREWCVEMAAGDEIRYEFQSDHSVEFDIHYHDGITVRYPLRVTDSHEMSGLFVSKEDQPYCLMWLNKGLLPLSLRYQVRGL